MKAAINGVKSINIVICQGDLNAASMIRLKNRLARLIHQRRKRLILDLGKAKHVDFSGLGILMERIQKIRSMRGDVRLVNLQPEVSETFDRMGINRFVESFDSKADAVRSFQVAA
ncbi:MAG: STAS domain-containing protein [Candidatus Omnitrophica bacterium]|nr:STAS domain-containing protein [Candidatus Omnitrophota bacterium]